MGRPLRFKSGVVQFMVRLPMEHREALQEISAREGIPVAEQIRRAIEAWTREHPKPKAKSRRVVPVSLAPKHAQEDQ